MAWVLVALIVLVNSPLLEPKRLAAADQLSRVLAGRVSAAKFDYDYLRFELGTFGDAALRRLSAGVPGHADAAEIGRLASAALAKANRWDHAGPAPNRVEDIEVLPRGAALDPELVAWFREQADSSAGDGLVCLRVARVPCIVLMVDLDGDGVTEVASVSGMPMNVFARTAAGWHRVGELRGDVHGYDQPWIDSVRSGQARVVKARWGTLELGGRRLHIAESAR